MPHSYAITVSPKHAITDDEILRIQNWLIKTADGFILWSEEGASVKKHLHGQVFYETKYKTPAELKKYIVRNIYGEWKTEEKQHGCRITRAYSNWYEDYSKVAKKDAQEIKLLKDLRPTNIVAFTKRNMTQRQDPEGSLLKQLRTYFVKENPLDLNPDIETVCHFLASYFKGKDFVGLPMRPERQRSLAQSLYFMLNENEFYKMFLPVSKCSAEFKWFQEKLSKHNL